MILILQRFFGTPIPNSRRNGVQQVELSEIAPELSASRGKRQRRQVRVGLGERERRREKNIDQNAFDQLRRLFGQQHACKVVSQPTATIYTRRSGGHRGFLDFGRTIGLGYTHMGCIGAGSGWDHNMLVFSVPSFYVSWVLRTDLTE